MQFLVQPALLEGFRIGVQLVVLALCGERSKAGFGGKRPGFDGAVRALDAGRVEKTGIVADQDSAREDELGQRLQAASGQRPRTIGNALAALQELADFRVRLEALELLEGRQVRVGVAEADHEADGDLIVFQMVEEAAAIGVGLHRPAAAVDDQAGLVLLGCDFPELLEADAVGLRIGAVVEIEMCLQLLAEVAAAALGEEGVLAEQFHAWLEVRAFAAVAQAPHVTGGDALDGAVLGEQHFGAGEAGVDFDAERLGLFAEPAADVAERDDVVAFVVEALRQQAVRHFHGAGFGEDVEAILADGRVERRAILLPVG